VHLASGAVATPGGPVEVSWTRARPGELELAVTGLRGRPTALYSPDGQPTAVTGVDEWKGNVADASRLAEASRR